MAAPAKFLFDMDFGAPDKKRERAATDAEIAEKVAAAEARAYRAGYDAAQREAKAESDRRSALALEEIGIAIKGIAHALFRHRNPDGDRGRRRRGRGGAQALRANWFPASRSPRSWRWSSDCFSHLVATPHLVVRINDQLYEAARDKIERLAAQSGFEGRLVILAEPGIATGDCRIEWADGGVVLERAAIEAKIRRTCRALHGVPRSGRKLRAMRTEP